MQQQLAWVDLACTCTYLKLKKLDYQPSSLRFIYCLLLTTNNECFAAAGAEPNVVAEMNTIAAMLGVVAQTQAGAIVAANAIGSNMGLCVVPMESPTPIRTPGLLFKENLAPTRPVRAFVALLRKTAMAGRVMPRPA